MSGGAERAAGIAEVAPGVYRLGTRWANFYLVVDGDEAIVVDAGYPSYLAQLEKLLSHLGRSLTPIAAALVTHHHVDHAGTAEKLRSRWAARVFVHANDADRVRGEQPSHPPGGFYRSAWRPSMIRYLAHTVRAGGARYRPVSEVAVLDSDDRLDLPGRPRVIPTPGHTHGHYSVVLDDRGVLFTGDALVNFDYASGRRGVRLHRFNEDRAGAAQSLGRLATLDAGVLLFGHGEPVHATPRDAVSTAMESSGGG